MKVKTKKSLALGWLFIAVPIGGVAVAQIVSLLMGIYDPVVHDHLSRELVPYLYLRLTLIILFSCITGFVALRIYRARAVN